MQPTPTASPAIDSMLSQGIAAAQAGDEQVAFGLLADVLRVDASCVTAWLWLSGVTSDPAERRYCLNQVVAGDPAHAAARRGLSLLPAVAPRNPLMQRPPPAPLAQASPAMGTTIRLNVLPRDDRADAAEPPIQRPAPPAFAASSAVAAAHPASAPELATAYSQEQIDFALRQLASGLDEDQAARSVCERQGMAWSHAQELVRYVKTHKAVTLARRQGPLYMVIGVITLIGGVLLALNYGVALLDLASSLNPPSPRVIVRWAALAFTGVSMAIGGGFGIIITLRSWWR